MRGLSDVVLDCFDLRLGRPMTEASMRNRYVSQDNEYDLGLELSRAYELISSSYVTDEQCVTTPLRALWANRRYVAALSAAMAKIKALRPAAPGAGNGGILSLPFAAWLRNTQVVDYLATLVAVEILYPTFMGMRKWAKTEVMVEWAAQVENAMDFFAVAVERFP